jgi:hypothetical protein
MKTKFFISFIFLLSVCNAYSQLVVNADGSVTVSSFKANGILSGFIGNSTNSNVSFGYQALSNPSTGANNHNVAIGAAALFSTTTGFANTAAGGDALYSNTGGYYNTAHGYRALYSNMSGFCNTAIGQSALHNSTEGNHNAATGHEALQNNTTGSYNAAHGAYSLPFNTTGEGNTANGNAALPDNTTGSYNTGIGSWALDDNTTGSFNTALGYYSLAAAGNLNNSMALGYQVTLTSSNQARVGNSSVASIGGFADWTNFSDGRAKKNIRTDVPGLAFINRLRPVTYNLDLAAIDALLKVDLTGNSNNPLVKPLSPELVAINKQAREAKEKQLQTGFVAQDVEKIAQSIGYDFSGVDVDEAGIYGLRYAEFVVPLVKAVQELSEQNDRLQTQNNQMQAQINELSGLVSGLLKKDAVLALRSGNVGEVMQEMVSSGASLQQNSPNPFSQSTVIRYTLPKTDKQAQMVISNTVGNIVRQIPLQAGTDGITIEGGALSAGVYYYSLYVGNGLVDTKKMILTK